LIESSASQPQFKQNLQIQSSPFSANKTKLKGKKKRNNLKRFGSEFVAQESLHLLSFHELENRIGDSQNNFTDIFPHFERELSCELSADFEEDLQKFNAQIGLDIN
jgi:hypothetical protein